MLLSEEGVEDHLAFSKSQTPLSLLQIDIFECLTLYYLVRSVTKSLFSRMSGFGWKGERADTPALAAFSLKDIYESSLNFEKKLNTKRDIFDASRVNCQLCRRLLKTFFS